MAKVVSSEHWVKKGKVDLYVYRKHLAGFRKGASPVLFLVHGSSLSAVPSFDLRIPRRDYSVMDRFAKLGFDVWTLDHEGYGRSSRTDSNSDVACGVEDLRAAMPLIARKSGRAQAMFFGQSSGALRAAAFAQACPERVERLVLDAFVWTGKGSPTLAKRRERLAEWRGSHRRKVDRAFFHTIFNRDQTGLSEDLVAETLADLQLAMDDSFPTGTYLDMCANLPLVDPAKITCPTQVIRGEFDGIATEDDVFDFFRLLPSRDKQFCLIAGQAHVGPLSENRHRFFHVMEEFLTYPERRDSIARKR